MNAAASRKAASPARNHFLPIGNKNNRKEVAKTVSSTHPARAKPRCDRRNLYVKKNIRSKIVRAPDGPEIGKAEMIEKEACRLQMASVPLGTTGQAEV